VRRQILRTIYAQRNPLCIIRLELRRTLYWKQRNRRSGTLDRLSTTRAILHKCDDQMRIKLADSKSGCHAKQPTSIFVGERCTLQRTFNRRRELPSRIKGVKRPTAHALARLKHLVRHRFSIDRFRARVGSWTLV
jgi:hypothetical protein